MAREYYINKDNATELQEKSVISRNKNTAERKAFRDLFTELLEENGGTRDGVVITKRMAIALKAMSFLTDDDLDAKDYIKVLEFIRDTVGEKPSEKVDLSIEDESAREIDEYFASRNNSTSGK